MVGLVQASLQAVALNLRAHVYRSLPAQLKILIKHRSGSCSATVGVFSPWWQVESEFQAAGPGLEGVQVAVLRLHVASSYHVMNAAYSCKRGGRITQLQYLLQLSLRTSENSVPAKFAEFPFHALR